MTRPRGSSQVQDNVFDHLEWADDCWQTSVEIPFFRDAGARLCEGTEGVTRRNSLSGEHGSAAPNPPIPLTIDTGGERRRPSNAQLEAWRRIRDRGEHIWRGCAERLRPEYALQRPARLRWWTAVYGPVGLDDVLPDVGADDMSFASLIVPVHVRIHEPVRKSSAADVGVKFACTWDTDGKGTKGEGTKGSGTEREGTKGSGTEKTFCLRFAAWILAADLGRRIREVLSLERGRPPGRRLCSDPVLAARLAAAQCRD